MRPFLMSIPSGCGRRPTGYFGKQSWPNAIIPTRPSVCSASVPALAPSLPLCMVCDDSGWGEGKEGCALSRSACRMKINLSEQMRGASCSERENLYCAGENLRRQLCMCIGCQFGIKKKQARRK